MPKPAKRVSRFTGIKNAIVECPNCHLRVIPLTENLCPSCHQLMGVSIENKTAAAAKLASDSPVTIFSPRQVFLLSFVSGWPAGLVLASINWVRMGLTGTAVVHWVVGTILFTLWSLVLNQSCGTWLGIGIQIGFCMYLYQQMDQSIKTYHMEGNQTRPAMWKSGCLLALLTALLLIIAVVLLILLLSLLSKSQ